MARLYELWDGETGNLIGAYASEQDALAAVHDTVHRYGPAAATALALAVEDERGEGGLLASGADLIERADAVARSSRTSPCAWAACPPAAPTSMPARQSGAGKKSPPSQADA